MTTWPWRCRWKWSVSSPHISLVLSTRVKTLWSHKNKDNRQILNEKHADLKRSAFSAPTPEFNTSYLFYGGCAFAFLFLSCCLKFCCVTKSSQGKNPSKLGASCEETAGLPEVKMFSAEAAHAGVCLVGVIWMSHLWNWNCSLTTSLLEGGWPPPLTHATPSSLFLHPPARWLVRVVFYRFRTSFLLSANVSFYSADTQSDSGPTACLHWGMNMWSYQSEQRKEKKSTESKNNQNLCLKYNGCHCSSSSKSRFLWHVPFKTEVFNLRAHSDPCAFYFPSGFSSSRAAGPSDDPAVPRLRASVWTEGDDLGLPVQFWPNSQWCLHLRQTQLSLIWPLSDSTIFV